MRRILYRKRRWLNSSGNHSIAFIWADLNCGWGTDDNGNKWTEIEGQIKISDCDRTITLYFGEDCNSVQKLQKLIGVLQEFQTALEDVYAEGPGPA